jgi:uncharacterized membrane protein
MVAKRKAAARAKKSRTALAKRTVSLLTLDKRLDRIEALLVKTEREERELLTEERSEENELQKLEALEREIKAGVTTHPLTKITYHDVTKGLVGAFFGVVGHFSFFYGHKIAEGLTVFRATAILFTSMLLLIAFLYFTGFRRVKEYHAYLPARFFVIYATAMSVAAAVLFLFGIVNYPIEGEVFYKEVASLSILAVMGAATADLIGGEA